MQNNSRFLITGIISFSFYILVVFFFIYYVSSPKAKKYTLKTKTTTIELDMIVEKSDKKRIEKKADKKIEKEIEKLVEKSASISNEKKPDVKSLFGKVKTKVSKVEKKKINNVVKSIDPKRFKSKFQKEKKSSNIKIDKLLNDKRTTTNVTSTNKSKSKESNDYFSSVQALLDIWEPSSRANGLKAKVRVNITPSGKFSYRILSYSGDTNFDFSLKKFLENQLNVSYPKPKKGKSVVIDVDFKSKG